MAGGSSAEECAEFQGTADAEDFGGVFQEGEYLYYYQWTFFYQGFEVLDR